MEFLDLDWQVHVSPRIRWIRVFMTVFVCKFHRRFVKGGRWTHPKNSWPHRESPVPEICVLVNISSGIKKMHCNMALMCCCWDFVFLSCLFSLYLNTGCMWAWFLLKLSNLLFVSAVGLMAATWVASIFFRWWCMALYYCVHFFFFYVKWRAKNSSVFLYKDNIRTVVSLVYQYEGPNKLTTSQST